MLDCIKPTGNAFKAAALCMLCSTGAQRKTSVLCHYINMANELWLWRRTTMPVRAPFVDMMRSHMALPVVILV